jgi:peptidoglycan/LPS O-acetylase OafA/YrhL
MQTAEHVSGRAAGHGAGRTTLRHMPALDGLRGLAVAAVLLFHAGHLTGGYLGVDLFFVLSGFLITSLLLAETARTGRISLSAFWARRARRLLPALAGVLIGVAAYAWLFAQPAELARIRADGLATVFYVANWRAVFAHLNYFELFAAPSPLAHTWSLAIEEQFYLVWPLVVSGVLWRQRRHRRKGDTDDTDDTVGRATARDVLAVSLVLGAASAIWMAVHYETGNPTRVYYGSDTRAASILVGASLAAFIALRGPVRARIARYGLEVAGVAGALVIAFAWTNVAGESDRLYRGGLFACAIATAAVIAAASHPERGPMARVLSVRPLRWLGIISYGVYLWHWPVYVVLNKDRAHLDGWGLVALRVAATLAISVVSYGVLEQPIRHGALRARQMRRLIPVAAALLVAAILASTGGLRVTRAAKAAAPDAVQSAVQAADRAPHSRRLLVVGNSVGWYLGDAFKQLRRDPPLTVLNRALFACTFPPGVTRVRSTGGTVFPTIGCTNTWASDVAAFDPDLVILSMGAGDAELEHNGRWLAPCTPEFDRWYRQELRQTAKVLASHGARVAIATAAYTRAVYHVPDEKEFDRADCTNANQRAVVAENRNWVLLDVARFICPTRSSCRVKEGNMTLRPDGVHFMNESARWMAGWMLDQVDRAVVR